MMDPVIQLVLGYGFSMVAGFTTEVIIQLIKSENKVDWSHLEELFFDSFVNAIKEQDNELKGIFKKLRRAIGNDREKVLRLFTENDVKIEPESVIRFFNSMSSDEYYDKVAQRIIDAFPMAVEGTFKVSAVVVVKNALKNYERTFIGEMNTEEGVKLIFLGQQEHFKLSQTIADKTSSIEKRTKRIEALLEAILLLDRQPPKPVEKSIRKSKPRKKAKQVKVLSITASPDQADELLYEKEQDMLLEAFTGFDRSNAYLDMPDPVKSTIEEIEIRLKDGKHDVLHISAHGSINDDREGVLSFEDRKGALETVTGTQLVDVLKKAHMPCIVILSACHLARKEPDLMPVANSLYKAGVPVVIGMKNEISHRAAIDFIETFFKKLCDKKTVGYSFRMGKDAIKKGEGERTKAYPKWAKLDEAEIPVLLTKKKNLTSESFSTYKIKAPARPQSHHFLGAKYLERGFIGRRKVLRDIFASIAMQQGAVVLKGPGGIGKSTLTTRTAANLSRDGYEFIVVQGETSIHEILQAIASKAIALKIKDAEKVIETNTEPKVKLSLFMEKFLLKKKVVIIFDNFEENQDVETGDFKKGKEGLKVFLWWFRDSLQHRDTFLLFSTRYTLPGFDKPGMTQNIKEFSRTELRKMLQNRDTLKRLDNKSVKTLRGEVGGNPRAMELLDKIAYKKFKSREFDWKQLKTLIPNLTERIVKKKRADDDFTSLFLDILISYLTPNQREILDALSVYRSPILEPAITTHDVTLDDNDLTKLEDLSLLEITQEEGRDMYYVHRLTGGYLQEQMEEADLSTRHIKAAVYFHTIEPEKGKKYLEDLIEARWHYIRAREWNRAAAITFNLDTVLTLRGSTYWAMELLKELKLDKMSDEYRAVAHNRMGILHKHFCDYNAALAESRISLKIHVKVGDVKGVATDLGEIGSVYLAKGEYDVALSYYKKSKEIFEKSGDSKNLAITLHQEGIVYFKRGDYDAALVDYKKSLVITDKIGDIEGTAKSLHQIGMIYEAKEDYDAALSEYQKSLAIKENIGDINGVAISINQVGNMLYFIGDYNGALSNYKKSKEIFEKSGDMKNLATTLHCMGIIYEGRGDYEASLVEYQKSLAIREKIGDQDGKAESMAHIGQRYFDNKEFETALRFSVQAFLIFKNIGPRKVKQVHNFIYKIREKMRPEAFKAVLNEMDVPADMFEPVTPQQVVEALTKSTVMALSIIDKPTEEKNVLSRMINNLIEDTPDTSDNDPLKTYLLMLLAIMDGQDPLPFLDKLPEELKSLFENLRQSNS